MANPNASPLPSFPVLASNAMYLGDCTSTDSKPHYAAAAQVLEFFGYLASDAKDLTPREVTSVLQVAARNAKDACKAVVDKIAERRGLIRMYSQTAAPAQLIAEKRDRILGGAPSGGHPAAAMQDGLDKLRERVAALGVDLDTIAKATRHTNDGLRALSDGLPDMVAELAQERVKQALKDLAPLQLTIATPAAPAPVALGTVHKQTPAVLSALGAGLNVYLHGPAGSGKTTLAQLAAKAFNLAFYAAAKVESEYLLIGFKDAQGQTVRTPFREAYENGGVFLFDELDASSPSAVVALNMALANRCCVFPDGIINMHPDFKCIAAGNTTMGGANRQYAGRAPMDGASIDRFFFIEWGYDEALEREIAPNKLFCDYVQLVRKVLADKGIQALVTPRATLDGAKALQAGMSWEAATRGAVYKGLDAETVETVEREVYRRAPHLKMDIL